jgi:hypothetical protein
VNRTWQPVGIPQTRAMWCVALPFAESFLDAERGECDSDAGSGKSPG